MPPTQTDTDKLIKNTYETNNTICGVRKIYKDKNRWSIVIPLLIRHRSKYNGGLKIYIGAERDIDVMFIGETKEKLEEFVGRNTPIRPRNIGKVDSRITIPHDDINNNFLEGIEYVAVEWHKEYNIIRIRQALPEDVNEAKYASRLRQKH